MALGHGPLLAEDDPRQRLERLPRLNGLLVRLFGTDLLTIRIDLDTVRIDLDPPGAGSQSSLPI